jgi:hypothetical protein
VTTTAAMHDDLDELLAGSPYVSYSYAYPHKTAYRPIEPVPLADWATRPAVAVSLPARSVLRIPLRLLQPVHAGPAGSRAPISGPPRDKRRDAIGTEGLQFARPAIGRHADVLVSHRAGRTFSDAIAVMGCREIPFLRGVAGHDHRREARSSRSSASRG